jgi:hypothetical protein
MDDREFWAQVYLECVRQGVSSVLASKQSDDALDARNRKVVPTFSA